MTDCNNLRELRIKKGRDGNSVIARRLNKTGDDKVIFKKVEDKTWESWSSLSGEVQLARRNPS